MTTNRPENLDDALIRPGRVDHQVAFSNATQNQIKELFERMYANDLPRTRLQSSSLPPNSNTAQPQQDKMSSVSNLRKELTPPATPTANGHATPEKINEKPSTTPNVKVLNAVIQEVQGEELSTLAQRFADQVPDGLFSPAELQGFLLKRKKDPRKACEEVGKWSISSHQNLDDIAESGRHHPLGRRVAPDRIPCKPRPLVGRST
jgi:mitochondrial chaperone BCS1